MIFLPLLCFGAVVSALPREPEPAELLQSRSGAHLLRRDLPIGTCNAATPCPNGACCGSNGLCGYSPAECGSGCSSNCDAKAQCGQYGKAGSQTCPLNVCCSQFGFCGSTDDFCGTGCQNGFGSCGPAPSPPCGGSKIGQRTIGYYESWANTRKCQAVSPEDLNLAGFTHLNFAFAFFDPNTFQITPMDSNSASLYTRVTSLKSKYSGLQVWISVGGWSFTDPGPTRQAFSNMVSSSANRMSFINGLLQFMGTYGFDGVDLDWEYPQADDRGGQPSDTENYVSLAQELKAALGQKGLSMTLPTSYWYLQHFDVKSLQESVDWFNFMAYDLHGVWDAQSKFVGPYIAPHTNLTEIDLGLQLLWRAGVEANKVVLGQGWYGRSFTLSDPSCNTPNGVCEFSGGADPGPCSGTSGILDDQEIQDIISQNNLQPTWDHTAGVKWITWNNNQWVSYDDADTFNQKKDFATARCLGGLMVWAIDQKDQSASGNSNSVATVTPDQQSNAEAMSNDQAGKLSCYTTDCNAKCKKGTNKVTEMSGQPGQISTRDRCPAKQYRSLCCNDGTTLGKCQWRGYRGSGLSCIQGCAEGETELVTDTNNHDKKDQTCNGGLQSYCCAGFKPPPSKAELEKDAADAAKDAAEAAAEQAALDVAAKAFCRIAVPALLAPLELVEDLIPIIGEIADAIEIAATPAIIEGCVKGIEKEGKAEFKIFGKEHSLSLDQPPPKPTADRPPKSSHEPEKTSTQCNSKRADGDGNGRCLRADTVFETNQPVHTEHPGINPRKCDGDIWPQACLHYQSVIDVHQQFLDANERGYNPLTCPTHYRFNYRGTGNDEDEDGDEEEEGAQIVQQWTEKHNDGWWKGYMQKQNLNCERDEYPPIVFWQDQDFNKQFIRMVRKTENRGAGSSLFSAKFCKYDGDGNPPQSTKNRKSAREINGPGRKTIVETGDVTTTLSTVRIDFINMPNYQDDGLTENPCWPSTVINDPGFALLIDDPWYFHHPNQAGYVAMYSEPPSNAYTAGKYRSGYQKRSNPAAFQPLDITLDDGNTTSRMTEEHLAEQYGFRKCAEPDCREELQKYDVEMVVVDHRLNSEEQAKLHPRVAEAPVKTGQAPGETPSSLPPMAGSGAEALRQHMPQPTTTQA